MVSIVRGQIADPHLVDKARAGQATVRPCISCNQLCWGRRSRDYWISCLINPSAGRELKWGGDRFVPAAQSRSVVVVGAGPAGLEAARVAAERGHESRSSKPLTTSAVSTDWPAASRVVADPRSSRLVRRRAGSARCGARFGSTIDRRRCAVEPMPTSSWPRAPCQPAQVSSGQHHWSIGCRASTRRASTSRTCWQACRRHPRTRAARRRPRRLARHRHRDEPAGVGQRGHGRHGSTGCGEWLVPQRGGRTGTPAIRRAGGEIVLHRRRVVDGRSATSAVDAHGSRWTSRVRLAGSAETPRPPTYSPWTSNDSGSRSTRSVIASPHAAPASPSSKVARSRCPCDACSAGRAGASPTRNCSGQPIAPGRCAALTRTVIGRERRRQSGGSAAQAVGVSSSRPPRSTRRFRRSGV